MSLDALGDPLVQPSSLEVLIVNHAEEEPGDEADLVRVKVRARARARARDRDRDRDRVRVGAGAGAGRRAAAPP